MTGIELCSKLNFSITMGELTANTAIYNTHNMVFTQRYSLLIVGTGLAMAMFYVIMAYFLRSIPICYRSKVLFCGVVWFEGEYVYDSSVMILYFELDWGLD